MTGEASDAGIGEPYWHEWTVGLRHVVRLLEPDSLAVGVTFQATVTKGVDNVVVRFRDGHREWIQVKHTRDEATLTFGDLVRRDPQTGTSLLRSLAGGWSVECAKHDGSRRMET